MFCYALQLKLHIKANLAKFGYNRFLYPTIMGKLLWSPIEEQKSQSEINKCKQYIEQRYQLSFASYHDLWAWSTSTIADFWLDVATYLTIKFHLGFSNVFAYPANINSFFGSKWFSGSTLNYNEHVFRGETGTGTNAFAHSNGYLQR